MLKINEGNVVFNDLDRINIEMINLNENFDQYVLEKVKDKEMMNNIIRNAYDNTSA